MAGQPTPMLSSSTIEMGSESDTRTSTGLTSDDPTALNTPAAQPLKREGYQETVASPVAPTPGRDDYPDGGFAAWCVVLGVSQFNHSFIFSVFLISVRSCSVRVLCSRRRLYSTSSVSSTRLISDSILSGPVSPVAGECVNFRLYPSAIFRLTLGVGIPIVLRTDSHTGDLNLNNVSPQLFTSGVQSI